MEAEPGRRRRAVGRSGVHARDAAGPRRAAGVLAHAGHRRHRLARARSRLRAPRRILRGDRSTTLRTQTRRDGFNQVDYEGIQHIPILRESWVISLHAMAQTTYDKSGQTIPFFMMPSIGGGADLRAYASWRLRDLNSLYVQAEWRVMVNRFMDMALFYDAGKVAARRSDLDLERPEERCRPRIPLARTGSRRRCASNSPTGAKGSPSCLAASQVF